MSGWLMPHAVTRLMVICLLCIAFMLTINTLMSQWNHLYTRPVALHKIWHSLAARYKQHLKLMTVTEKMEHQKLLNRPFHFEPLVERSYALAIYIRSAPTNREMVVRDVIRHTWMQRAVELGCFVRFCIGATSDPQQQLYIEAENTVYNDILLFNNFYDNYYNLSLKTRETLRHFESHRSAEIPTIYVWTNTDGFVIPDRLVHYIDTQMVHRRRYEIHGDCTCYGSVQQCNHTVGPAVMRDGKWALPFAIWPTKYYPNHCMGYTVLFGPKTPKRLLALANQASVRWLRENWIDDVTYTGILREPANLMLQPAPFKILTSDNWPQPNLRSKTAAFHTMEESSPTLFHALWDSVAPHRDTDDTRMITLLSSVHNV